MSFTGNDLEHGGLAWANCQLRSTGRGKHMVQFSYYHVDLIAGLPDVADSLPTTIQRFAERQRDFNVVKLARTRLSFLLYAHFPSYSPLCSPHCPATPCTVGADAPIILNGQAPRSCTARNCCFPPTIRLFPPPFS